MGSRVVFVDVNLDEGMTVFGRVIAPKAVRLADLRIDFSSCERSIMATVAADGCYRASGATPGRYQVEVSYPNAGPWGRALATASPSELLLRPGDPPIEHNLEVVIGGWLRIVVPRELLSNRREGRLDVIDGAGIVACRHALGAPTAGLERGTSLSLPLPEGLYRIRLVSGSAVLAEAAASVASANEAAVTLSGFDGPR